MQTVHKTKNNLCILKALQIYIRSELNGTKLSQSFTLTEFGQKIQIFFEYVLRNDRTVSVLQTTPIGYKLVDVRHPVGTVIECVNKTNQVYYRLQWTLLELQNSKPYFRRNFSAKEVLLWLKVNVSSIQFKVEFHVSPPRITVLVDLVILMDSCRRSLVFFFMNSSIKRMIPKWQSCSLQSFKNIQWESKSENVWMSEKRSIPVSWWEVDQELVVQ